MSPDFTITKLPADNTADDNGEVLAECPASTGSLISSPPSPVQDPENQTESLPVPTHAERMANLQAAQNAAAERQYRAALVQAFGEKQAEKILAIKRCSVCQGRLKPWTDPKVGAGSNRQYGVTPELRCIKCGRTSA